MAELKAPPAPSPITPGTIFIKNPTGAVHDINEDDPRSGPALDLANKSRDGWSLASAEEIAAYCELHNLIPPGKKAKKAATEEAESPVSKEAETAAEQPTKKARRARRAKKGEA